MISVLFGVHEILNCWVFAEHEEYREKGRFLYGESMGGAVALLLHRKDPAFYNGAVLVAPMCKVTTAISLRVNVPYNDIINFGRLHYELEEI